MLVSRAGMSPVMVGRETELEQLRRLVADMSTPTIALIGGEPGIGKTRLASELVGSVAAGTTPVVGQADPGGLGQPYQLLYDLARDRHPELTAALAGDPMDRRRAAVDLLRALVGAAREGTTPLLVVDDLHWADPESLAVFEHLEEVTAGPLLLLGTYRPEELSRRHPLAEVLERLDRRRGVTHLRLGRLAPAGTARFLAAVSGRVPPRRVVTALHDRTGGNPFFLEELLKAAGDNDLDEIHTQPLPWNLAEALRSQLDGLAPDQRQVVEAAAVLGARVSFDLLATVTDLAEPQLVAALRALVDRGLLVEVEEDEFGFRHTLTREAVAGEMLGRQRRRLHEAALRTLLAADSPDLAAVAVHARGAGRYSDMIDAARRGAAERLANGSPYGALTLAELALEEVPDDDELLVLAGTAAWRAGYLADARRHSTRALSAATDDPRRVAALTQLIRVAWEQGELVEMDGHTEQVRAVTDALPDGEVRARAIAAVAQSYMLRHRPEEAVEWADRAHEVAERHGLKAVRISALVEKGSALQQRPATAAAGRRLLTEAAAEAEHAGAHLEATRAWHNLFWYLPRHDPSAPEMLERMRATAERAGVAGMALGGYHSGRAWLAVLDGDLDRAIAVLEQAWRLGRGVSAADPASDVLVALQLSLWADRKNLRRRLVELYVERGDLDAAEALLAEAPPTPRPPLSALGLAFLVACWRGELATARRLVDELARQRDGSRLVSAQALHCQVAAGLAAGLPVPLLHRLADRDTGYQDRVDPPEHPLRMLVAAQLAEAEGRHEQAAAEYARVTGSDTTGGDTTGDDTLGDDTTGDDMPGDDTPGERPALGEPALGDVELTPAFRGTAAVGAGRCLVVLGRLDEARSYVSEAAPDLARWSGWRYAEFAVLARRLGGPGPAAAGTGTGAAARGAGEAALTRREQQVARLVGQGLTNSEIARRLVISRKTAAVHVSHILAKLSMSSRTQVAAWVAGRAGPDASPES